MPYEALRCLSRPYWVMLLLLLLLQSLSFFDTFRMDRGFRYHFEALAGRGDPFGALAGQASIFIDFGALADHFGVLVGRESIFIDFLLNSQQTATILGPWLAGVDFHRFSIKFLLESDHFGVLAGWCLIFIDFLLNSY